MAAKICRACGGQTNTAVCDWVNSPDDKADKCFARFENGEWVKGCAHNQGDCFTNSYVDRLLEEKSASAVGNSQIPGALAGAFPCNTCPDKEASDDGCRHESSCEAWKIYLKN